VDKNFRAEVDDRGERMNQKIRQAQMQKIPYMLILGDREQEQQAVSVRSRESGDLGSMQISDLVTRFNGELTL
jgi:threonyl-tRNA synthetase